MILNEKKEAFGVYCGLKTGTTVFVSGNYAVIKFHSDDSVEEKGFLILFIPAPASKYLKVGMWLELDSSDNELANCKCIGALHSIKNSENLDWGQMVRKFAGKNFREFEDC